MSEIAINRSDRSFLNQVFSSVKKFAGDFIAKNGFNRPSRDQVRESRRKGAESMARRVIAESNMLTPFIPDSKLTFDQITSLSEQKAPKSFFSKGKLSKEKVQEALIYLAKDKSSIKAYDFHSQIKFENGITNLFSKAFPKGFDLDEFSLKSSASQIADVLKRGPLSSSMRTFLDGISEENTTDYKSDPNAFFNKIWETASLDDILSALHEKTLLAEISFDQAAQVIVNLFDYIKETKA